MLYLRGEGAKKKKKKLFPGMKSFRLKVFISWDNPNV